MTKKENTSDGFNMSMPNPIYRHFMDTLPLTLQSKGDNLIFKKTIQTFTVKTLNIGTPRPATVVVLNIKQFYFTMK